MNTISLNQLNRVNKLVGTSKRADLVAPLILEGALGVVSRVVDAGGDEEVGV